MTLSEKMARLREERNKQAEFVLFWIFLTGALAYLGAHILAAHILGRLPA